MQNKKKDFIYIIIIIAVFLFAAFREWRNGVNVDDLVSDIATYKDTATYYKTKNGAEVATNLTLKLQSEKQLRQIAGINDTVRQIMEKFKDLKAVTNITNQFFAGKDTIKIETKIPCNFKPFKVRRSDSTYNFAGTIAPEYFSVDSIFVPNKISIVQGRKKIGFLKYDYSVDVVNSNPLMKTSNISDYRLVPKKKFYEKTWFHLLTGAGIGYIGANVQSYLIRH